MAHTICLTGKGKEHNVLVSRSEWERRIAAAGHYYTDNAANCTVLVASRNDTHKAINARARGAKVETYEWLSKLLADAGAPNPLMQPPAGAEPEPAPIDTREMEGSPLWGLF